MPPDHLGHSEDRRARALSSGGQADGADEAGGESQSGPSHAGPSTGISAYPSDTVGGVATGSELISLRAQVYSLTAQFSDQLQEGEKALKMLDTAHAIIAVLSSENKSLRGQLGVAMTARYTLACEKAQIEEKSANTERELRDVIQALEARNAQLQGVLVASDRTASHGGQHSKG